ncbi:MAG: bifunctional nuclease domain-containing protein [Bacteroidota bacterium]
MKKIPLEIVALSHSVTASHNYAVVLGEQEGVRRLPIVIGGFEAQAIAVAMERMTPSRPLTHDLMRNVLSTFNIELKEIVINNLLDGIFYAILVCEKDGVIEEIDSRTSDALALAVRFDCPIYTYEFILDAAGVVLEEAEGEEEPKETKSKGKGTKGFGQYSTEELQQILNEVLEQEDYERAAKIRDEIKKRNEES